MKIAFCLSGLSRSLWYTWPLINEYLVKQFNGDVFLHTWDIDGYDTPSCLNEDKLSYINNRIAPQLFIVDNYNSFFNDYGGGSTAPMYYSIMKSNELKSLYEKSHNFKYDIVFRLRMDLMFDSVPKVEELERCIKENLLLVSWHSYPNLYPHSHVSDMFGFSTSAIMDIYSSSFWHWKDNRSLKHENVLEAVLCNASIPWEFSSVMMKYTNMYTKDKVIFCYGYHE